MKTNVSSFVTTPCPGKARECQGNDFVRSSSTPSRIPPRVFMRSRKRRTPPRTGRRETRHGRATADERTVIGATAKSVTRPHFANHYDVILPPLRRRQAVFVNSSPRRGSWLWPDGRRGRCVCVCGGRLGPDRPSGGVTRSYRKWPPPPSCRVVVVVVPEKPAAAAPCKNDNVQHGRRRRRRCAAAAA